MRNEAKSTLARIIILTQIFSTSTFAGTPTAEGYDNSSNQPKTSNYVSTTPTPTPLPSPSPSPDALSDLTDCSGICKKYLVHDGKKPKTYSVASLSLKGTWSEEDDKWCANHGKPTDSQKFPYVYNPVTDKCKFPMLAGDKDCAEVTRKYEHCTWKTSNVGAHCQAWASAQNAASWNARIMALDFMASLACSGVCASPIAPTVNSCTLAGMKAAETEITAKSLLKKQTEGMLSNFAPLKGIVDTRKDGFNEKTMVELSGKTFKGSCIAVNGFAILSVKRGFGVKKAKNTAKASCNEVKRLWSQRNGVELGGDTGGAPSLATVRGGGSSASGGRTGGIAAEGNSGPRNEFGDALDNAVQAGALDAGLLNDSGLANELMDKTAGLDVEAMMDAVENGDPGAALGGAMASAGLGPIGEQMAAIAGEASQDAQSEGYGVSGTSYASSGGGGGAGGGGKGSEMDLGALFGNLAGNGAGGAPVSATGEAAFGNRAPASDIWHTGSKQNLFEIVSGKIGQVTPRLIQ